MNVREAYLKVRTLPGRNVFVACIDLGDRWAFNFYVKALKPGELPIPGGRADTVRKRDGQIGLIPINPTTLSMIDRGQRIDPAIFEDL
jgi:hypothetical protein